MSKGTSRARGQKTALPAASAAPRLGPLADFIGFHLRLAQEASFQAFARRVRDLDLRPGRFAALALIGWNPGISQTALGRASGRDKSSLTPALDDLERRGLVNRRRSKRDRRIYTLSLTPKGEKLLDELMAEARAHDRRLDRIVGLKNKAEFVRTLRRIAMALT
jgi:DNA-binding MarR family transcriptional regulator